MPDNGLVAQCALETGACLTVMSATTESTASMHSAAVVEEKGKGLKKRVDKSKWKRNTAKVNQASAIRVVFATDWGTCLNTLFSAQPKIKTQESVRIHYSHLGIMSASKSYTAVFEPFKYWQDHKLELLDFGELQAPSIKKSKLDDLRELMKFLSTEEREWISCLKNIGMFWAWLSLQMRHDSICADWYHNQIAIHPSISQLTEHGLYEGWFQQDSATTYSARNTLALDDFIINNRIISKQW
ncbi:hypothetical protein ANN_25895 [Periplaneta americana]|uniref:Uncharacterized protein n=1 Tax=Periplaneta americana TaxID=6978 RepID=A0ABQ8S4V7_PERAM|nr:hypothetical protein ANN_25895 [Periplaneta americana]